MKTNLLRWLLVMAVAAVPALLAPPAQLAAQQRTITGRVIDAESRQPLPGVRVSARAQGEVVRRADGAAIETVTDQQGRFLLTLPPTATSLVFTGIGLQRLELPIQDEVEAAMTRTPMELEEIVVTALGIQREKRSLSVSVQDVGEEIAEVPELNLVNALQGQIAGVHITDAGPTGGTSRIVIRGASSISGQNQPLFIVDGVPVDNGSPRNRGFGGIDYGNTVSDIDPNNVESISVLKGPNAAALYGSRASNGAVVITTKSGETGSAVSITTSLTTERPLRLPSYQNVYGQGFDGEFQWVDGAGGGTNDYADESWGPRMSGQPVDQFTGAGQPFLPHPDNVRNFFETGTTWQTNVAVSHATDNSNVRLSVTYTDVQGMMPGSKIGRLSAAVKGGAAISPRLYAEGSLNYMGQDSDNRPGTGYDEDNPLQSFIWFGRQVDMNALKNYRCYEGAPTPCEDGGQFNWNYNYHNNPYWEQLVNTNTDTRNRVLGYAMASYQLNDWISVTGRLGRDWYRDFRKANTEFYSLDDAGDGGFGQSEIYVSETNADLIISATRNVTSDFGVTVTGVGNLRKNKYETSGVNVTKLTAPSIFSIDNAAATPNPFDYESDKEVRSLRGSLALSYRDWLFVDATASNDWSSTLPEGANSYFYPSIGGAFVFTEAMGLRSSLLSSGKVRASWTRVGNDTDPYRLTAVLNGQQQWGAVPMFAIPNELPNAGLKPELTTSWEVGGDFGFFDERAGFVVTYYDRTTKDQILGVQVSSTSGYTSQLLNAGKIRNYGLELLVRATPVDLRSGFRWDMTLNWAKNNSQVRELYGDLETLVLEGGGGTYWSLNIEARGPRKDANGNVVEYYPYGTLFGNPTLRDDQGRLLLDADGLPQVDAERRVLGQYTPDWNGGIANRFSYGAFQLSVLFDGQWGGTIFSTTKWFGEYSGVLDETLAGRESDICDPGIVVAGVLPDGSVNGDGTNDVSVCPQDYHHSIFGDHERGLVDATYLKLREMRLAVRIPRTWTSVIGFDGGEFALIGRNLALWSKAKHIDPETAFDASNVQGIEFGQFPTARSLGFSLTLRR